MTRRPCGCGYDPGVFGHCWPEHDQAQLEARLRAASPGEWLGILAEHEETVRGRALESAAWAERDLELDAPGGAPVVRGTFMFHWFVPVDVRRRRSRSRRSSTS